MNIPAQRWYNVIGSRVSRRQYDENPIPPDLMESMRSVCENFRPFPTARTVLIPRMSEYYFSGIIGSYGAVKGAISCIAFIGDSADPDFQTKLGYTGEGVILEATALSLGTCWVGGFFKRNAIAKAITLTPSEKIMAISPVGFVTKKLSREEKLLYGEVHARKPLMDLVRGFKGPESPPWVKHALEAARLAPSATNRQPWRFTVDATNSSITISEKGMVELNVSRRLDCGIAMLHLETAALNFGIKGSWEFLESPEVARFSYAPK